MISDRPIQDEIGRSIVLMADRLTSTGHDIGLQVIQCSSRRRLAPRVRCAKFSIFAKEHGQVARDLAGKVDASGWAGEICSHVATLC